MNKNNKNIKLPLRFGIPWDNENGFTLIEIIMVIIILGILSGVVGVVVTDTVSSAKITNAVSQVLSDVRYAQEMAMTRRREVDVRIITGSNRYEILWTSGGYLKSPSTGNNMIVTFGSGTYGNVTMTSTGLSGNLRFDADGRPTIAGTPISSDTEIVKLNSNFQIMIQPSGFSYLNNLGGGGGC